MKFSRLIQIIKEELEDFYDYSDEQGMADRYFEKNYGTQTTTSTTPEVKIDAELIGYVDKQWQNPLKVPIPLYKNPKTLKDFGASCRGVLLNNGDFYVAPSASAMHENILHILAEKGIIPYANSYNYGLALPEEFIAVQRVGGTNTFAQSSAYDKFPEYYQEIFRIGNQKQPYSFEAYKMVEETESPLDPNNLISYRPEGYVDNNLYERKQKK